MEPQCILKITAKDKGPCHLFTGWSWSDQAAGKAEEDEEEDEVSPSFLSPIGPAELVEFLGDTFQLRLDGCQTFNLRLLWV